MNSVEQSWFCHADNHTVGVFFFTFNLFQLAQFSFFSSHFFFNSLAKWFSYNVFISNFSKSFHIYFPSISLFKFIPSCLILSYLNSFYLSAAFFSLSCFNKFISIMCFVCLYLSFLYYLPCHLFSPLFLFILSSNFPPFHCFTYNYYILSFFLSSFSCHIFIFTIPIFFLSSFLLVLCNTYNSLLSFFLFPFPPSYFNSLPFQFSSFHPFF